MEESTQAAPQAAATEGPVGLGGWLILPAIGMFVNLLLLAYNLLGLAALSSGQTADAIATSGIDIHDPAWARLVAYEFGSNSLLLLLIVGLLVLFFTRSWLFPGAFIAFLALNLAIRFGDLMLAHGVATLDTNGDNNSYVELMRPVLYCVIWIPYFLKAVRVRNTFIRPWPMAKPASAVSS
ncbi:MAG TPA: DUF2569 domain-containing protein [Gammaproteobacteria bacterium]|jgi:hypothetical protein